MELNIWIAFWAGLVSFVSPCCLPLYPSYLSYITGISVQELKENAMRKARFHTMAHTLFFILGFSLVYYFLGATAGALAALFHQWSDLISQIAGIFIILVGLVMLGIFQPKLLMKQWKPKIGRSSGYAGSWLFGIGFAAGWSPCIGPILSGILGLAVTEKGSWFALTTAYTLGFALPFFILSFFIGSTRWLLKYSGIIMKAGGAAMVVVGVLLFTGRLQLLSAWLQSITPDWMIV